MKVKISKLKELLRPAGEINRAEGGNPNITGARLEEKEKGESPGEDPDLDGDGVYSPAELDRKSTRLNSSHRT